MNPVPTMDLQPILPEPTIDPEPPDVTPVAAGPSQASESKAAGRGRGAMVRRAVIGLALAVTFSMGIGVGRFGLPVVGGIETTAPNHAAVTGTEFGLIREAWDILHTEYVGARDLKDQELIYGAIRGMTQAVGDTGHTSFLTPKERADSASNLSGSYVGIGVRIDVAADKLPLIVGVFRGSPAEKAGLVVGQEIVAVDSQSTVGKSLDEVAGWVRGRSGSTVALKLRVGSNGAETTVSMVRAAVAVQPVSWAMVPGTRTALLRLDQFSQGATDLVKAALGEIRKAGADRIILDLRGNPGGYVNEAEGVASQFLSKGDVFIERAADGRETHNPVASGGVATDIPLVVLVDAGTASSAEIVSGAIQDANRAQIVGVKTYGTGTVLGEFPLSDGSALRVGTVEWLTPNGRQIWHQGITPDAIVERASNIAPVGPDDVRGLTPAEFMKLQDPQLTRGLQLVTAVATAGG